MHKNEAAKKNYMRNIPVLYIDFLIHQACVSYLLYIESYNFNRIVCLL